MLKTVLTQISLGLNCDCFNVALFVAVFSSSDKGIQMFVLTNNQSNLCIKVVLVRS